MTRICWKPPDAWSEREAMRDERALQLTGPAAGEVGGNLLLIAKVREEIRR